MAKYYWATTCARCRQGRLVIQRKIGDGTLYLHCEECEMGWHHPREATEVSKGFLTLLEDFEADNPTLEEITAAGWGEYVAGSFEV